jgi:hypothetical protein
MNKNNPKPKTKHDPELLKMNLICFGLSLVIGVPAILYLDAHSFHIFIR